MPLSPVRTPTTRPFFDQHARRGELREEIDAHLADDRRHPADEFAERDDVVAVVLQRRRHDRRRNLHFLEQVPERRRR